MYAPMYGGMGFYGMGRGEFVNFSSPHPTQQMISRPSQNCGNHLTGPQHGHYNHAASHIARPR